MVILYINIVNNIHQKNDVQICDKFDENNDVIERKIINIKQK